MKPHDPPDPAAPPTIAPRLRRAVVLLCALIVALLAQGAWLASRAAPLHALEIELAAVLARQGTLAQRAGRDAAVALAALTSEAASTLAPAPWRELIEQTKVSLIGVDECMAVQLADTTADSDSEPFIAAHRRWRDAQSQLVAGASSLLAAAADAHEAPLRALQRQGELAAQASQAFIAQSQLHAAARAERVAGLMSTLALLALAGFGLMAAAQRRPLLANAMTKPNAVGPNCVEEPAPAVAGVSDVLPTRAAALQRLLRTQQHAARCHGFGYAVLALRLQGFEPAPQTLGEAARERLASAVLRRLLDTLRPGDAVARVSPADDGREDETEQFVVILEGVQPGEPLQAMAERLHAEMRDAYTVLDHPLRVHAAVGVAAGAAAGLAATRDAEQTLQDAELALELALRDASVVHFTPAMREQRARELAQAAELRRALMRGEFSLVYQPVIDLAPPHCGRIATVVAELRWTHATRGVLARCDFANEVELAGAGALIGVHTLRLAAQQFEQWSERLTEQSTEQCQGRSADLAPPRLALALWPGQLDDPDFVTMLLASLVELNLPPSQLELSLVEAQASTAAQREALAALREHGVQITLDGLGSASPSLTALQALPLSVVRIGRGFVAQAAQVEAHHVLIKAIVSLADAQGMLTRAEGVDSAAQRALMAELGATQAQGEHLGAAMPAADFTRWLLARETIAA